MTTVFHDIEDGTGCVLFAQGIRVDSWTKIVRCGAEGMGEPEATGDEEGKGKGKGEDLEKGWEIREEIEIRCNWFFLGLLERNVTKARKELHAALIKRVEEGEGK